MKIASPAAPLICVETTTHGSPRIQIPMPVLFLSRQLVTSHERLSIEPSGVNRPGLDENVVQPSNTFATKKLAPDPAMLKLVMPKNKHWLAKIDAGTVAMFLLRNTLLVKLTPGYPPDVEIPSTSHISTNGKSWLKRPSELANGLGSSQTNLMPWNATAVVLLHSKPPPSSPLPSGFVVTVWNVAEGSTMFTCPALGDVLHSESVVVVLSAIAQFAVLSALSNILPLSALAPHDARGAPVSVNVTSPVFGSDDDV